MPPGPWPFKFSSRINYLLFFLSGELRFVLTAQTKNKIKSRELTGGFGSSHTIVRWSSGSVSFLLRAHWLMNVHGPLSFCAGCCWFWRGALQFCFQRCQSEAGELMVLSSHLSRVMFQNAFRLGIRFVLSVSAFWNKIMPTIRVGRLSFRKVVRALALFPYSFIWCWSLNLASISSSFWKRRRV